MIAFASSGGTDLPFLATWLMDYLLAIQIDKLTLINHLWKCRKGERLMITTNSFTKNKIGQLNEFCLLWRSG